MIRNYPSSCNIKAPPVASVIHGNEMKERPLRCFLSHIHPRYFTKKKKRKIMMQERETFFFKNNNNNSRPPWSPGREHSTLYDPSIILPREQGTYYHTSVF